LGAKIATKSARQERSSRPNLGATTAARGTHEEPPWEPTLSPRLRPGTLFKSHLGNQNCRHNCRRKGCEERFSRANLGATIAARDAHQEPTWEPKSEAKAGEVIIVITPALMTTKTCTKHRSAGRSTENQPCGAGGLGPPAQRSGNREPRWGDDIVTKTAARGAHQQPPWEPKLPAQVLPKTPMKSYLGNQN
jgi:hypothetical protein